MLIFIIRLWLIINSLALSLEDSHRIRISVKLIEVED